MKSSFVCLAICGALLPVAATADDSLPKIIGAWHEATGDTTAVRASVRLVQYDDTFHIQKHATGTFGYLSPGHGFWRLDNDTTERQKRRVTHSRVPYEIRPFASEHLRWHTDRFLDISDKDRSFSKNKIVAGSTLYLRFISADLFCTVDWATPFLPGRPNKTVADQWAYTVWKQTDSHTWIRALPKADSPLVTALESSDLYFQHDPVRLLATRSTSITGNHQTVIVYSDINLTPEAWPEPDLSEYEQVDSAVQ